MIEDNSQEEVTLTFTREEVAMLFDKARQSRSGWEEMAVEDLKRRDIPDAYRGHTANRAAAWRRIEEKLSEAIGGNPGLKLQKKLLGIRRL